MTQFLELGHLPEQHPMAQMEIGSRGIEASLHAKRAARLQSSLKHGRGVTGDRALEQKFEGIAYGISAHVSIFAENGPPCYSTRRSTSRSDSIWR